MTQNQPLDRILILGAGGVGWWLTTALMRDPRGCEVIVFDDDDFQGGHGRARLPWQSREDIPKVKALRSFISMAMGDRPPVLVAERFTESSLPFSPDEWKRTLVVDCTDLGPEIRKPLWAFLRSTGATLLRVSYDGNGIIVVSRGLPLADKPGGGYALVPTMPQAIAAGGLGAMAIHLLLEGKPVVDYQIQLGGEDD